MLRPVGSLGRQRRAVLGRKTLTARDHQLATEHVVSLLLRGCGL